MLKLCAISDLHLGEPSSVLHHDLVKPEGMPGKTALVDGMVKACGQERKIETLIFLGDTFDLCLSTEKEVIEQFPPLLDMILNRIGVKNIVVTFGNHDHARWTRVCEDLDLAPYTFPSSRRHLLYKQGEPNSNVGGVLNLMLSTKDKINRRIKGKLSDYKTNIILAYPHFLISYRSGGVKRNFLFHHGQYVKKIIVGKMSPFTSKKKIDNVRTRHQHAFEMSNKPWEAESFEDLERRTSKMIDSLWPETAKVTGWRDKFWHLCHEVEGMFKWGDKEQPLPQDFIPEFNSIPDWDLNRKVIKMPGKLMTSDGHSLPKSISIPDKFPQKIFNVFFRCMEKENTDFFNSGNRLTPVFIFGDTHNGGYRKHSYKNNQTSVSAEIETYNTGAWVNHYQNHYPETLMFCLTDESPLEPKIFGVKIPEEAANRAAEEYGEH